MDESTALVAAPIIAALVEVAKKAGLPTTYAGPAAIVFAFGVVALLTDDPTSREAATTAIVAGLTAAGMYSQATYYMERVKDEADAATAE